MKQIILLLSVAAMPMAAWAHAGKTKSTGWHVCKTNCDLYGEVEGASHYHPEKDKDGAGANANANPDDTGNAKAAERKAARKAERQSKRRGEDAPAVEAEAVTEVPTLQFPSFYKMKEPRTKQPKMTPRPAKAPITEGYEGLTAREIFIARRLGKPLPTTVPATEPMAKAIEERTSTKKDYAAGHRRSRSLRRATTTDIKANNQRYNTRGRATRNVFQNRRATPAKLQYKKNAEAEKDLITTENASIEYEAEGLNITGKTVKGTKYLVVQSSRARHDLVPLPRESATWKFTLEREMGHLKVGKNDIEVIAYDDQLKAVARDSIKVTVKPLRKKEIAELSPHHFIR